MHRLANVSGIHIGDHLPKIAQIMDRLTLVCSLPITDTGRFRPELLG